MGIDLLDLTFRLEKRHKVCFDGKSVVAMFAKVKVDVPGRRWWQSKSDFKVGQFFEAVRALSYSQCAQCTMYHSTLPNGPVCSGCGRPLQPSNLTWEQFADALAEVLKKKPADITPDKWLIQDYGFS